MKFGRIVLQENKHRLTGVILSRWTMTSFRADECCHLVNENEASARRPCGSVTVSLHSYLFAIQIQILSHQKCSSFRKCLDGERTCAKVGPSSQSLGLYSVLNERQHALKSVLPSGDYTGVSGKNVNKLITFTCYLPASSSSLSDKNNGQQVSELVSICQQELSHTITVPCCRSARTAVGHDFALRYSPTVWNLLIDGLRNSDSSGNKLFSSH